MKVSVIIPVYNSSRYIEECINSVLNQTLKDTEIIVIDDGSTDNSLDKIKTIAIGHDNITIISTSNMGVAHARNIGLDIASGEYIKFLDSDDSLSNNKVLEEMYNSAIENEADTVVGLYYTYAFFKKINLKDSFNCSGYHQPAIINPSEEVNFVFEEMPNVGNKLFSRKLIGDLKFPEKLNWEDLALVPALMAGSEKIYFNNQTVCDYRMHFNTSVKNALFAQNIFEVFPIFQSLGENIKHYGMYDQTLNGLKGMYALHTSLKACGAMSWLNMSQKEKMNLIKLFMNYVELTFPHYKEEETLINYFETHPFFNHQFEQIQKMLQDYQKVENIDLLEHEIETTLNKSKVLKRR